MSKILLAADLHAGVKSDSQMFLDLFVDFFEDFIVKQVEENDIKSVFLLGDLFENRNNVNGNNATVGFIKARGNSILPPIIPPIIMNGFLPFVIKWSVIGPNINLKVNGIDANPATIVVVAIEISFSVKYKIMITSASEPCNPFAK